jgi:hypothetical protein
VLRVYVWTPSCNRLTPFFLVEDFVNNDICHGCKENADTEGQKCEPGLRDRKVIWCALEDVWEGGEEEKQDTESERGIHREKEHHGLDRVSENSESSKPRPGNYLCEKHMHRSQQFLRDTAFNGRPFDLWRRDAKLLCALLQNDGLIGLLHGEGNDECSKCDEDQAPLCPAISLVLCRKATHNRSVSISNCSCVSNRNLPKSWSRERCC